MNELAKFRWYNDGDDMSALLVPLTTGPGTPKLTAKTRLKARLRPSGKIEICPDRYSGQVVDLSHEPGWSFAGFVLVRASSGVRFDAKTEKFLRPDQERGPEITNRRPRGKPAPKPVQLTMDPIRLAAAQMFRKDAPQKSARR